MALHGGRGTNVHPTVYAVITLVGDSQRPADPTGLDAAEHHPAGLTVPDQFVGRDKDIASILGALLATPAGAAVLVQGGPGIGKSTLTKAVARQPEIVRHFGEQNRWFVPLGTAATAEKMQTAILQAFGWKPNSGLPRLLEHLGQHPGLLILDNLETPWEPEEERPQVEAMLADLAGIPGLAVMASFRGHATVEGPAWSLVHPLSALAPTDAEELFLGIVGHRAKADPALSKFTGALGGLPLAVELVAARAVGRRSLASLWTEWQEIGPDLASRPDAPADRDSSLSHSLALSLRSPKITPLARRLLGLLGLLPAGIADIDRDALLERDARDAAEMLRTAGLAITRDGRLDLLPPVRDYARRVIHRDTELATGCAEYFLELVRAEGSGIFRQDGDGAGRIARLVPELPNIEMALDAAADVTSAAARSVLLRKAVAGLEGLQALMSSTGLGSLAPIEALAGACDDLTDRAGEAACWLRIGILAHERGDDRRAQKGLERGLDLYSNLPDDITGTIGQANCTYRLGDIQLSQSQLNAAGDLYRQAWSLYQKAHENPHLPERPLDRQNCVQGIGDCVASLGDIACRESRYSEAREQYVAARALFEEAFYDLGEANCVYALADIERADGSLENAEQGFLEAIKRYSELGYQLGIAHGLRGLGEIAERQGNPSLARDHHEQARRIYKAIDDINGEAFCDLQLGRLDSATGDLDGARARHQNALRLFTSANILNGVAQVNEQLALCCAAERVTHLQAAYAALIAADLPNEADRVARDAGLLGNSGQYPSDDSHAGFQENSSIEYDLLEPDDTDSFRDTLLHALTATFPTLDGRPEVHHLIDAYVRLAEGLENGQLAATELAGVGLAQDQQGTPATTVTDAKLAADVAQHSFPPLPTEEELRAAGKLYEQRTKKGGESQLMEHLLDPKNVWAVRIKAKTLATSDVRSRDYPLYQSLMRKRRRQPEELRKAIGYEIPLKSDVIDQQAAEAAATGNHPIRTYWTLRARETKAKLRSLDRYDT